MFENIRSGYARLSTSGMDEQQQAELADLGIYEDEESRAARAGSESDNIDLSSFCPARCIDFYDNLPSLTLRERLLGCGTMMVCGYFLSFGSFFRVKSLVMGNPVPIVVNVTVGNIIALCGTLFFTGPQMQFQRMFHKTRKLASVFYLGSLGATVFLLLVPHFPLRGLLLFLLMIGQYVAITWYCLSYIPFAREFVTNGFRHMISGGE